MENKPITWQMLKNFVNGIPDELLGKTAVILFEDESTARELLELFNMENDVYIYDEDWEICGTFAEIKQMVEDNDEEFNESLCKLATPKGTPFLRVE